MHLFCKLNNEVTCHVKLVRSIVNNSPFGISDYEETEMRKFWVWRRSKS